jgi:hypothetical protein
MGDGIKVQFEYGGMSVDCDEETFARLRAIIGADRAVVDAVNRRSEATAIQFFSVRLASADRAVDGPRPIEIVQFVFAVGFSAVVHIAGFITIFRWFGRILA